MKTKLSIALLTSLLALSPVANANLSVNVGAINVNPDNDSSKINEAPTLGLRADDDTQLGITVDYALDDNWVIAYTLIMLGYYFHWRHASSC